MRLLSKLFILLFCFHCSALAASAQWAPRAPMPQGYRFLFQDPVEIENKFYVVASGHVWAYDPVRDEWQTQPAPLRTPRPHHALAAFKGKLYTFGGLRSGASGENIQAAVEEFDPRVGAWEQRASLPGPRRDPCAVVVDSHIYLVGGFYTDATQPLPILAYDPAGDTWRTKQTVSRASSCWGAHVINGQIYILGSQEEDPNSSVLEIYDPAIDRIVLKTPIPGPRKAYTTAVLGGRIYAIGGQLQKLEDAVGSIDVYDPAKDTWTKVADLPKPKSWAGAVGTGTRIYVLGGVHTDWFQPESAVDVLELGVLAGAK